MTVDINTRQGDPAMSGSGKTEKSAALSVLPFSPEDLMRIRVNQAELARMMDVSRQTVSQWVKDGKISTFPDGSIDPHRAMKEYLLNTDGSRMRAKILRPVTEEIDALRSVNADLATRLDETSDRLRRMIQEYLLHHWWLNKFIELLEDNAGVLVGLSEEDFLFRLDQLFNQSGDIAEDMPPNELAAPLDADIRKFLPGVGRVDSSRTDLGDSETGDLEAEDLEVADLEAEDLEVADLEVEDLEVEDLEVEESEVADSDRDSVGFFDDV